MSPWYKITHLRNSIFSYIQPAYTTRFMLSTENVVPADELFSMAVTIIFFPDVVKKKLGEVCTSARNI